VGIGAGIGVRVRRYGPYVDDAGADRPPKRASITDDIAPDEMTPEKGRELLETASEDGRVLGQDPSTGRDIVAKAGRYGPYVSEVIPEDEASAAQAGAEGSTPKKGAKKAAKPKPRTASLFTDMDLATIELDTALRLLSLPRVVGADPESGEDITAQNGRYGPYLKKGTDSRSLATEDQIFDITLQEALALYAQPKQRGRAASPPLKELGEDPVSGKPVVVKDGRFGPYVTDGEVNATLRKDDDPDTVTAERGFELLAEKRAKGPTTRKKTTRKKTTTKKGGTTKAAPKKAATTKTASAKRS